MTAPLPRPRVAMLLGAGASFDARPRLPLLHELTQRVERALSPSLRKLYRTLGRQRGDASATVGANIEDILTAADALATARASLGGAHPRDFALLALAARSEIWRQLQGSVETDFLDPLAELLPWLRPLSLFSLNNDLVIETWCRRRSLSLCAGFDREDRFDPSSFARSRSAVRLYKLHGSVDWSEDGESGIRYFRGMFRTAAGRVPLRTPVPDVALVFPSRVKRFGNLALLDLLLAFRRHLRSLDLLVIVGCQLGDPHVLQALLEACRNRLRPRILVVDPAPEAALARLLPRRAIPDFAGRVDALRLGFGEALRGPLRRRIEDVLAERRSLGMRVREILSEFPAAAAAREAQSLARALASPGAVPGEQEIAEARQILALWRPSVLAKGLITSVTAGIESSLTGPGDLQVNLRAALARVAKETSAALQLGAGLAIADHGTYLLREDSRGRPRLCRLDNAGSCACLGRALRTPGGLGVLGREVFVVERSVPGYDTREHKAIEFEGLGVLRGIDARSGQSRVLLLRRSSSGRDVAAAAPLVSKFLARLRSTDRRLQAEARQQLLASGFLSWAVAVRGIGMEHLAVVESVRTSLVRADSGQVELVTKAELLNLSDCAQVDDRTIALLEGGAMGEGRLLLWDLAANTVLPLVQPLRHAAGVAWDAARSRLLITIADEAPWGAIWEVRDPLARRRRPPALRPVVERLHRPLRLGTRGNGWWLCTSGNGLLRLSIP